MNQPQLQIVIMNFLENITVEEEGPRPEAMVTGKPQRMSLNAVFLTDGYDVPASATPTGK